MSHDGMHPLPVVAHMLQPSAPHLPPASLNCVRNNAAFLGGLHQLARATVDELRAELDGVRQTLVVERKNSASDSVARLENARAQAAIFQHSHRRQAGYTGADYYDISFGRKSAAVH